jgi:hypothetical protein
MRPLIVQVDGLWITNGLEKLFICFTDKQREQLKSHYPQHWTLNYFHELKNLKNLAKIDDFIEEVSTSEAPTLGQVKIYQDLADELKELMTRNGFLNDQEWDLITYGSAHNSLCTRNSSDLDLTLIVSPGHNHFSLLADLLDILLLESSGRFKSA